MPDASNKLAQQNQNRISAVLIIFNIILALIYTNCTPQREDDFFIGLLGIGIFIVLLQAIFVFTYRGKAPLSSKWVLAVFILITLLYAIFIAYVSALGKAFQH